MDESFFFFQAEDGIRDKLVTGVQTCALPIYCSMTASITRSESRSSSRLVVPRRRTRVCSRCASLSEPFSTSRCKFFSMLLRPFSINSAETSRTTTWQPACATTWAMPEPISPQPTTPTRSIGIASPLKDNECNLFRRVRLRHRLDNHGDALPAADAGCGQPVAQATAAELVEKRQHKAGSSGAQRMAEGDCAAVDVGFLAIEP